MRACIKIAEAGHLCCRSVKQRSVDVRCLKYRAVTIPNPLLDFYRRFHTVRSKASYFELTSERACITRLRTTLIRCITTNPRGTGCVTWRANAHTQHTLLETHSTRFKFDATL